MQGCSPIREILCLHCMNGVVTVVYAENDHDSQTADKLKFTDGSHLDLSKTMHNISLSNTIL